MIASNIPGGLIHIAMILSNVHLDIFEHAFPSGWIRLIQTVDLAQVRIETIIHFGRQKIVKYGVNTLHNKK